MKLDRQNPLSIRKIPDNIYQVILHTIPIVCVDCVIQYQDKFLLIRRKDEPAKDEWWLVGGRQYKNESLESCAIRKCKEEVGLNVEIVKQLCTKDTMFETGPFNIQIHSVNVVYHVVTNSPHITMDNTISDYKWIELPSLDFNSYINECLERVIK